MKKILLPIVCLLLLTQACKKDRGGQEGYETTTAYKNTLNVQVSIYYGGQYKTKEGKDTTVFSETGIVIKAGETYESSYFVCTKNCPEVYYTSVVTPPDFTKMIIGDKVKIDTNCTYYFAKYSLTNSTTCGTTNPNIFEKSQWNITKDKDGNIIREEYVIDAADLAEAK